MSSKLVCNDTEGDLLRAPLQIPNDNDDDEANVAKSESDLLREQIATLHRQLDEERARRAKLNTSVLALRQQHAAGQLLLENKLQELSEELTAMREAYAALKEEAELNAEISQHANEELQAARRAAEAACFGRDCLQGDVDELSLQLKEKDAALSAANRVEREAIAATRARDDDVAATTKERDDAQSALTHAQQSCAEKDEAIKAVTAECQRLKDQLSQSNKAQSFCHANLLDSSFSGAESMQHALYIAQQPRRNHQHCGESGAFAAAAADHPAYRAPHQAVDCDNPWKHEVQRLRADLAAAVGYGKALKQRVVSLEDCVAAIRQHAQLVMQQER